MSFWNTVMGARALWVSCIPLLGALGASSTRALVTHDPYANLELDRVQSIVTLAFWPL